MQLHNSHPSYQPESEKSERLRMKSSPSDLIKLLILGLVGSSCLSVLCAAEDFDFFYFVQQWPGSFCDTKTSCCYPTTGKPAADFGIHGLWPNYKDGSYPSNCDPNNPFDQSQISDLISSMQEEWPTLACPSSSGIAFWTHEWEKHGTCSETAINQHSYFAAALDLKKKANLLQALQSTGIKPNGESYTLADIKAALKNAIGYTPYIECNVDESGNSQLYQVYLCVDTNGSDLIECPIFPHGKCGSSIEFPTF
uniref:extracellular ribonuclease LE-like n=1 Tax=Fragaria vesca subsp. vesca TaxID=101020 RepID=UPI0005CAEAA1|nr:PREDICTED: extracellular ribonuclease LE-like [Fragaria vesca subsp. vesca]